MIRLLRHTQRVALTRVTALLAGILVGYSIIGMVVLGWALAPAQVLVVVVLALTVVLLITETISAIRGKARMRRLDRAVSNKDFSELEPGDWEEVQIAWARTVLNGKARGR